MNHLSGQLCELCRYLWNIKKAVWTSSSAWRRADTNTIVELLSTRQLVRSSSQRCMWTKQSIYLWSAIIYEIYLTSRAQQPAEWVQWSLLISKQSKLHSFETAVDVKWSSWVCRAHRHQPQRLNRPQTANTLLKCIASAYPHCVSHTAREREPNDFGKMSICLMLSKFLVTIERHSMRHTRAIAVRREGGKHAKCLFKCL